MDPLVQVSPPEAPLAQPIVLPKKPKPVILETLKIVLGRETYQIAKNLPVADRTDPDSFLQALT